MKRATKDFLINFILSFFTIMGIGMGLISLLLFFAQERRESIILIISFSLIFIGIVSLAVLLSKNAE